MIVQAIVVDLTPTLTSHLKNCYLKADEMRVQIISRGKTVPIFGGTVEILSVQVHNRAAFQMKAFRLGKSTQGKAKLDFTNQEIF